MNGVTGQAGPGNELYTWLPPTAPRPPQCVHPLHGAHPLRRRFGPADSPPAATDLPVGPASPIHVPVPSARNHRSPRGANSLTNCLLPPDTQPLTEPPSTFCLRTRVRSLTHPVWTRRFRGSPCPELPCQLFPARSGGLPRLKYSHTPPPGTCQPATHSGPEPALKRPVGRWETRPHAAP